jgi:hypothetical protein
MDGAVGGEGAARGDVGYWFWDITVGLEWRGGGAGDGEAAAGRRRAVDRAVLARGRCGGVYGVEVADGLDSGGESAPPDGEVNGGCQRGGRRGGWSGERTREGGETGVIIGRVGVSLYEDWWSDPAPAFWRLFPVKLEMSPI